MARALLILIVLLSVATVPARAQGVWHSPDIEHALGKLTEPNLRAADSVPSGSLTSALNDMKFSAFLSDKKGFPATRSPDEIRARDALLATERAKRKT